MNKPLGSLKGASPKAYSFLTDNGQFVKNPDCIVPIVKQNKDKLFIPLGTGFYICNQRILMTATHVLNDVIDPETQEPRQAIGIFHLFGDEKYIPIPIIWAWHSGKDISICVTAETTHNSTKKQLQNKLLQLSKRQLDIHEPIVTYAYAGSRHEQNGKKQKLHFRPNFYDGSIEEYYPHGRDSVLMPFPCYRTNIHLHGGSSGGPVVDKNGYVIGVNCSSMTPDTDISFITPISAIENGYIENARLSKNEALRRVYIKEFIELGTLFISKRLLHKTYQFSRAFFRSSCSNAEAIEMISDFFMPKFEATSRH